MLTSRPVVLSLATFIYLLVLLVIRDGRFLALTPINDAPQPSDGYRHDVALVVASMKKEDTSRIQKYLPGCLIFIHASSFAWHNDDPGYNALPTLRNFRISHLQEAGYANLRCARVVGCPAEIRPVEDEGRAKNGALTANGVFRQAWHKLMMPEEAPVPEVVAVSCCSQLGVTRETIRNRPLEDYVRFRDWLLRTPLEDSLSGRVLGFSWHIIFGKEAVHCPSAQECYCKTFGICDSACSEGACDGRYTLPPHSTLPEDWPRVGWENEERNFTGPLS
ncbi:hypothetical protein DL767_008159 [Monosporascus sp. MG133]|nr:hypothetical protein DL767_008159 [Monosporascus sp. MG133]